MNGRAFFGRLGQGHVTLWAPISAHGSSKTIGLIALILMAPTASGDRLQADAQTSQEPRE